MNEEQHDMLIRHDEQLKALALLPAAVTELAAQLRVANAQARLVALIVGGVASVIGCVGTWVGMVIFH
jgi:hypothetical protein